MANEQFASQFGLIFDTQQRGKSPAQMATDINTLSAAIERLTGASALANKVVPGALGNFGKVAGKTGAVNTAAHASAFSGIWGTAAKNPQQFQQAYTVWNETASKIQRSLARSPIAQYREEFTGAVGTGAPIEYRRGGYRVLNGQRILHPKQTMTDYDPSLFRVGDRGATYYGGQRVDVQRVGGKRVRAYTEFRDALEQDRTAFGALRGYAAGLSDIQGQQHSLAAAERLDKRATAQRLTARKAEIREELRVEKGRLQELTRIAKQESAQAAGFANRGDRSAFYRGMFGRGGLQDTVAANRVEQRNQAYARLTEGRMPPEARAQLMGQVQNLQGMMATGLPYQRARREAIAGRYALPANYVSQGGIDSHMQLFGRTAVGMGALYAMQHQIRTTINLASTLEMQMARIQGVVGHDYPGQTTSGSMRAMRTDFMRVSRRTGLPLDNVADIGNVIFEAGSMPTRDAMEITRIASMLAMREKKPQMATPIANILMAARNAFNLRGKDMERFGNMLFEVKSRGVIEFPEIPLGYA